MEFRQGSLFMTGTLSPGRFGFLPRRLATGLILLVIAGLAVGLVVWLRSWQTGQALSVERHLPEDPRLTYTGPFRNVRPGVAYVGDEACADCHRELVQSFRQHRKGQNFQPVAHQTKPPPEDPAHHNPFEAFNARFQVERQGEVVRHRRTSLAKDETGRPIYDTTMEVSMAIGTWTNGFSYLCERDGYVFQSPISWFAQKGVWDISPGFGPDLLPGRPILHGSCTFCHANRLVQPLEGYQNRYQVPVFGGAVVSCERRHGPGQIHVAAHPAHRQAEATGKIDDTIVNPHHLPTTEREAICEQCHMIGLKRVVQRGRKITDYRPGLRLQDFLTIFVVPPSSSVVRAATHVEYMRLSKCFSGSNGKLGCSTCHDSHVYRPLEQRRDHYRQACLGCHQTKPCRQPVAERLRLEPNDHCTNCHMPRYAASTIPHTASTDHRIPRRPSPPAPRSSPPAPPTALTPFHTEGIDPQGPEMKRNLGIALGALVGKGTLPPQLWSSQAVDLLGAALQRDPEDWDACQAQAAVYEGQDRFPEALAALERILAKVPRSELPLAEAAFLAEQLKQMEKAETYCRRAIELNPWLPGYRAQLTSLLARRKAWDEALTQSGEWLRLDPSSVEGRSWRIKALLRTGRFQEAQTEFRRIKALNPPNLAELEAWLDANSR